MCDVDNYSNYITYDPSYTCILLTYMYVCTCTYGNMVCEDDFLHGVIRQKGEIEKCICMFKNKKTGGSDGFGCELPACSSCFMTSPVFPYVVLPSIFIRKLFGYLPSGMDVSLYHHLTLALSL